MDKAFTLVVTGDTAALFLQHPAVRCTRCTPVVDIASGAGKIRDNGDMCCLAAHFCHFLSHKKNSVTMLTSGALVSFLLGTNRFKFGATVIGCIYKVVEEVGIVKLLWTAFASVFWVGPLSIRICKTSGYTCQCFRSFG